MIVVREQLRDRLDGLSRQRLLVGILVVLIVGAPVAYAGSGLFTAGSTFKTDSGLSVQVQKDQSLGGNPFNSSYSFDGDGGTITAESDGDGYLEVQQWGGSSSDIVLTDIQLSNTSATVAADSSAVDRLTVGGTADSVQWRGVAADDGVTDISVTNASGVVNVTIYGLTSGETYRLSGGGTPDGAKLTAEAENSKATFGIGSGDYSLTTYDNSPPTVTNLNPEGDVLRDQVTLAADVDDDTFDSGDVDVTFRVNGDVVHQTNISSAQRVNYTLTASELPGSGTHSWSVTATDALGAERAESGSFSVPGELVVRNVSDPSETIPNATAVAFTDDGEIELSANSSGVIDLDPLPGGEYIPIEIQADGYHERTTVVPTIIQANDAYLIPENETNTVQNRFTLNDPTGEFDSDSVVLIERSINQSGENRWRVVAGDEFGVEGFTERLVEGERYRLRIVSRDGDVAQMGKYTAEQTQEVPLRPQSPAVGISDDELLGYAANVTDSGNLVIQYEDPTNETDILTVYAVSPFNESDYLVEPQTFYGTNQLVLSEPVGDVQDSYIVYLEGQRGGESFTIRIPVGPDQISIIPGGLSQVWLQIGSVGVLLMVGGVFSRLNAGIGALVTSLLGGVMWYTGMLSGLATWASVAVAIVFSVVFTMVSQR